MPLKETALEMTEKTKWIDNGFRETTEVIRHGLTLGRAAEDTVRLWKDHFDILSWNRLRTFFDN